MAVTPVASMPSHPSALRRLLVLLDDGDSCARRVQVAAQLAVAHGCELEGFAPTGTLQLPAGMHSAALAIEAADQARDAALLAAEQRIGRFRALAEAAGARHVTTQAAEGDTSALLVHRAACHDLVVIGLPDPAAAPAPGALVSVEAVLLNSPRPTLLVPPRGVPPMVGRHIVVAWDDGPACIRAATEALPVLQRAERVHLCTWHRSGEGASIGARLEAVAGWLALHGVHASPHVQAASGPIGAAMLEGATRLAADMIVMGTYGHARWLERITGGATRSALAQARIPLFMAH